VPLVRPHGPSIQLSSKNRATIAPASSEKLAVRVDDDRRASSHGVFARRRDRREAVVVLERVEPEQPALSR
jgi:hypothetical protein